MRRLVIATLALCLAAVAVFAQSNTGTLVGTVSGPDGVIAGATITLTDTRTGKERTVTSGGEGSFSIPQLDPGTYTVKVTAQGFKSFTATDIKIDVGREYSLKPVLAVGDINETVTVTGGAETINSTNAELSNNVSVGSTSGAGTPLAVSDGPRPRMRTFLETSPVTMNPAMETRSPTSTNMRVEMLSAFEGDGGGLTIVL